MNLIQRILRYCCPQRHQISEQMLQLLDLKRQIVNGRQTNRYFCLGVKPYFLLARYDFTQQTLAQALLSRLEGLQKCIVRDSRLTNELTGIKVRVDPQNSGMLELNDAQAVVFDFRDQEIVTLKDRVRQINAMLAVMDNVVIICSNHKNLCYLAAVISARTMTCRSAPMTCSIVDCPLGVLLLYGIDNVDNLDQRDVQQLILRQAGLGLEKNELQEQWAQRGGQYFLLKLSQSIRQTQIY